MKISNFTMASSNCTPLSFDYIDELAAETHERQKYVAGAYGAICAVGLIANIVLMTSLLGGGNRGVTYKTPSTILIINLAIADMLLLLTLPFAIVHRLESKWIFGNVMCKLEEGIKFLNYYGSVFFITAMAVDRYVCLCRPATYDRRMARKTLWMLSAALWMLSLVFVVPLMVFADVDAYGFCSILFPGTHIPHVPHIPAEPTEGNKTVCLENIYYNAENYPAGVAYEYVGEEFPESMPLDEQANIAEVSHEFVDDLTVSCRHPPVRSLHVWLVCNFVFGFVIPFSIISISYAKIMLLNSSIFSGNHKDSTSQTTNVQIQKNGEPLRAECTSSRTTRGRFNGRTVQQNQKAKMLMGILVPCLIFAFAVCWLPYHAWHLAQINGINGVDSNLCNLIRDITFCLAFFNSALNPILNSFFLFNFKERLIRSSSWLKKLSTRRVSKNKRHGLQVPPTSQQDGSHENHSAYDVSLLTTHVSNDVTESGQLTVVNSPV